MRCLTCIYLDWDAFDNEYEITDVHFCGLHGRHRVDPSPSSPQLNLDNRNSCGYHKKDVSPQYVQLSIFSECYNLE